MKRIIKVCTEQYKIPSLDLVEKVFTEHENADEGRLVRRLVEEIRSKKYYLPELELIEYGFKKAVGLGYKAVLVEGDPRNYRARGFQTAADHGIYASENLHLPHIDCLMVRELVPGGLDQIHGIVDYGFYESLSPSGAEQDSVPAIYSDHFNQKD